MYIPPHKDIALNLHLLICIFLMTCDVGHFSCAYLPKNLSYLFCDMSLHIPCSK